MDDGLNIESHEACLLGPKGKNGVKIASRLTSNRR